MLREEEQEEEQGLVEVEVESAQHDTRPWAVLPPTKFLFLL